MMNDLKQEEKKGSNRRESGYKAADAGQLSKESKKGIAEAVKWLEQADCALAVMDSPKDPKTPVNDKIKGIKKQSKKRK